MLFFKFIKQPSSAAAIKLILDRTRGYLPEIVAPKPASKQKPGSAIKSGGATFTKKTNAIVPPTKVCFLYLLFVYVLVRVCLYLTVSSRERERGKI